LNTFTHFGVNDYKKRSSENLAVDSMIFWENEKKMCEKSLSEISLVNLGALLGSFRPWVEEDDVY